MRECGMLLPISSLPSPYGIGSFSREAYEFVDQLKAAGQRYWQILPLGPTGYGDSPYQAFSAFAGNPYFIDLTKLAEEGLLTREECDAVPFGENARYVDYGKVYEGRYPLLRKAYANWKKLVIKDGTAEEEAEKCLGAETRNYCFYMALKNHFGGANWSQWEKGIRLREKKSLSSYRKMLSDEIGFYEFLQIKFQEQWKALKAYANEQGVKIIGDIPIYVSFDSADSWAHPELFQFDEENLPAAVAGCPPDAFSATGQLWGNPLYRWKYHKKTNYAWWMERMSYSLELYDVVRVDHFRGFDEYYSIPYGDATAEFGHWEPGPGIEIFRRMQEFFGKEELPIIAEDLGYLTPTVLTLLKDSGFPGMKVLEFAFDASEDSTYLPHKYDENCVVYTGTHDNDTLVGWFEKLGWQEKEFVCEYIGRRDTSPENINWDVIRLALASKAKLAMVPVQDYIGLGSEGRINEPSTLGTNWQFRLLPGELTQETIRRCRRMAELYGRAKRY